MGRLEGKRAVITGGSNGIGRAIVEAFIAEGAAVFFTAHTDREAAEAVVRGAERGGTRPVFTMLEAAEVGSAIRLRDEAVASMGGLDILVNNAATITRTPFFDVTIEQYTRILDVNLRFPFFATQAIAQYMREVGIRGSIINISSVSATSAVSRMTHYQCSKAGLEMLTRGAAYELAEYGIRVNTISPGLTATRANRDQWRDHPEVWRSRAEHIPLGPGKPTDHAGAAVFLASDESSWVTGANIRVDGGYGVF